MNKGRFQISYYLAFWYSLAAESLQLLLAQFYFNVLAPASAVGIFLVCTFFCFSPKLSFIYIWVITPYYVRLKFTISAPFLDTLGGRQCFLLSLEDILLQNYDSDHRSDVYPPVFSRHRPDCSHGRLLSSIFWKIWDKLAFPGKAGLVRGSGHCNLADGTGLPSKASSPLHSLCPCFRRRTKASARHLEHTGGTAPRQVPPNT